MWYFIVGAAVGVAQLVVPNLRRLSQAKAPIQGVLAAAALGAAVYGTILWAAGSLFWAVGSLF